MTDQKTRTRGFAVLAFALANAPAMVTFAADIYLSPGASIAQAVNHASPGDRILVRAGTYTGGGWIGPVNGTASAPITVLSVDGPLRAVIQGGNEALRVGSSSYLIFDGFEIRNSGDNVVHIDGQSHHVTLRNIFAHDAGFNGDVVKINQSHHITVQDSELARPGRRDASSPNPYQECLDFVDVDDSKILNNFIHDGGSMLAFVKGGSRNPVIEGNVFSQQRDGASDPAVGLGGPTDPSLLGGEQYEVINVVFRNNIVMNGTMGAIAIYDANGAFVANNILLNNNRVLVEFRAGSGPAAQSTDVRVVNNIMMDTRGQMPTPYVRSSHGLTDFATSNNLFWNNGAPIPSSSLINVAAQPGHLVANPLVAVPAPTASRSTAISVMRPASGSPATDSGLDASGAPYNVTTDITGVLRTGIFDRGPFSLGGSTSSTSTSTSTSKVTSVSYIVTPSVGVAGKPSTITASSTGSSTPTYHFWVVTTQGIWTQPCGGFIARNTCAFTPNVAGTWQVAVSARDVTSTARYEATTGEHNYTVTNTASASASLTLDPSSAMATSADTQSSDPAEQTGECLPGQMQCVCDGGHHCYVHTDPALSDSVAGSDPKTAAGPGINCTVSSPGRAAGGMSTAGLLSAALVLTRLRRKRRSA